MRVYLVIILASFMIGGRTAKKEEVKQDLKSLEGRWTVVGAEGDGVANGQVKEIEMVFAGDAIRVRMQAGCLVGHYHLDSTAMPKLIDYTTTFVDRQGLYWLDSCVHMKGIYCLDGKMLKICKVEEGDAYMIPKKRPTDFKCPPDSDRVLLILRKR